MASRRHTESRRAWVERQMAQGRRSGWITEHGCGKFNCSVPSLERDMAGVRERWAQEAAAQRDAVRAELAAQIDHAVARVHQRGDVKALAGLLRLKAQFHGFIAEKNDTPVLTPDEHAQLLADLSTRPKAPLA